MFIIFLWVLGNTLSDQNSFTQWLEWIPTILIVLWFFVIAVISCIKQTWREASIASVLWLVLLGWYVGVENKLFTNCKDTGELKLVAWTMSHPKKEFASQSAATIINMDADITVLTHGWYVRGEPAIQEWLGSSGEKLIRGTFTVLSKLKPIKIRTLIASDGIHISSFKLDAQKELGKSLVIWAIDLPSEFSKPRFRTAMIAKRLLEEIEKEPPDIVAGDFNMTRDSYAMEYLFPKMRHATDDCGCGLLASYPRAFPIYHIDHILLNSTLKAVSYHLHNPSIGRHRIQVCKINNAD